MRVYKNDLIPLFSNPRLWLPTRLVRDVSFTCSIADILGYLLGYLFELE